jgi:FKBP-type peptidyl-prolyl cis-trans isomerase FkpA
MFLVATLLAQQPPAPAPAPSAERQPTEVEGKPTQTASGLKYFDLKVGTGKKAIHGFTVRVDYTGWVRKGRTHTMFDTSVGKEPIQFDLGMRKVIKGWDEGLYGMRVGGKRQLIIPPNLGYGDRSVGVIPAGSTLIFEVELLDVR